MEIFWNYTIQEIIIQEMLSVSVTNKKANATLFTEHILFWLIYCHISFLFLTKLNVISVNTVEVIIIVNSANQSKF